MRSLRVLQIGDVHYPDAKQKTAADVGDAAFPTPVVESMLRHPLQGVVRAATVELQRNPVDVIFVCGDLTTKGKFSDYEDCLDYLNTAFTLRRFAPDRLHAVPGNHDIDRALVPRDGADLEAKFAALSGAWSSRGLSPLTVSSLRATTASASGDRLAIYSLNSCLGCGERRHLPEEISKELGDLLDTYVGRTGLDEAFALVGETLDTPGFRQVDIESLCEAIGTLDARTPPLILSHHNLLPQAILRVRLYTEVMNAGIARSRFTRFPRTVIYCHGHIHDDPIEIITNPDQPAARMICISAPELEQGFNIVRLEFGVKGYPLGCVVARHRLSDRDGSVTSEERRISLHGATYSEARFIGHPKIPEVLAKLPERELYFLDAYELVKRDSFPDQEMFAGLLREAQWLGLMEVLDGNQNHEYWRVRKIGR